MGITSILDAQNRKGTTDFAFHGYPSTIIWLTIFPSFGIFPGFPQSESGTCGSHVDMLDSTPSGS